jgi:GNAT superfamily N-acetyltransferase
MTRDEYRAIQRCPLYRRDLDLVAVAPDGSLAGFATTWFDDTTRTGFFEPVGVHPGHRRRGLGQALLAEGMRLLAWLGADLAYTASYGPEAGGSRRGRAAAPVAPSRLTARDAAFARRP